MQKFTNQHPIWHHMLLFDILFISLVIAGIYLTRWVWCAECAECYCFRLIGGRGLPLHSFPFYSVGVCVQVGANLSVYFVTQVADCIANMRLWKVHIGARRPVRVLTSVWFIPGIFPWSHRSYFKRKRSFTLKSFQLNVCVCYVHQPLFISLQWIVAQLSQKKNCLT